MVALMPAGVILAGGLSSRMGVARKALLRLGDRTLLEHVIGRLQPQLSHLLLSCESQTADFDHLGLPLVPDLLPHQRGPLAGLYSALQYLENTGQENGLVLCPCDAPFIPGNLVQALLDAGQGAEQPAVVVSYQGEWQPTFSMWRKHHLEAVRDALVMRGLGGLKAVLRSLPHEVVEWAPSQPPPFFNVNTPADLEVARMWLDRS
jgi:molybdopterin-guanine dinucleotide biosynthesis protein A